jgi:hypothetical protein
MQTDVQTDGQPLPIADFPPYGENATKIHTRLGGEGLVPSTPCCVCSAYGPDHSETSLRVGLVVLLALGYDLLIGCFKGF